MYSRSAFSRRRLLGAAAPLALLLAGCSTPAPAGGTPADSPVVPLAPLTPMRADPAAATGSPAAVAARYRGIRPRAWGMALPGIVTTVPAAPGRTLALTFDACDGAVDHRILDTLRRLRIPATVFLNQRWVRRHRELTLELAADPLFRLGNHGTRHVPLSVTGRSAYGIAGTANSDEAVDEVMGNQRLLTELTGTAPRWFRTGTAHYDDVGVSIVAALGLQIGGFSVNADAGATLPAAAVAANLLRAPSGAVAIMHMNHPERQTGAGVAAALPRLVAQGVRFRHLDDDRLPAVFGS